MRVAVWLFALAACGSRAPEPSPPVGNQATTPAEPAPPARCLLRGVVVDAASGEPLLGATLVFTGAQLTGERVLLSDEAGQFTLEIDRHPDELTLYFADLTTVYRFEPGFCGRALRVPVAPGPGSPGEPRQGTIVVTGVVTG